MLRDDMNPSPEPVSLSTMVTIGRLSSEAFSNALRKCTGSDSGDEAAGFFAPKDQDVERRKVGGNGRTSMGTGCVSGDPVQTVRTGVSHSWEIPCPFHEQHSWSFMVSELPEGLSWSFSPKIRLSGLVGDGA